MTEPSIESLRRASSAIYLACEEAVAADISNLLQWAAKEIKQLRANAEYWRLCAERRDNRKERTGLDIPEARTLDAPAVSPQDGAADSGKSRPSKSFLIRLERLIDAALNLGMRDEDAQFYAQQTLRRELPIEAKTYFGLALDYHDQLERARTDLNAALGTLAVIRDILGSQKISASEKLDQIAIEAAPSVPRAVRGIDQP